MTQKVYYFRNQTADKKGGLTALFAIVTGFFLAVLLISTINIVVLLKIISPIPDKAEATVKPQQEVFGFAPHWTFNKLDNVDFSVLTTLAYFGYSIKPDGSINTEENGYRVFHSEKATDIFKRAHDNGTRVVLTITQMNNDEIKELLDNDEARNKAIDETIKAVKERGIDGVNIDFEYAGNPGEEYKDKFTKFVSDLNHEIKREMPESYVTVSVYASAAKYEKMYDIGALSDNSDGIFMMAYDFATSGSDNAIPTAPLYGHKEGKYWYDVSTAVDDFLKVMPKEKLILGLPWYGYNYPVSSPEVKAVKDEGYYSYYWWKGRQYYQFIPREAAYAATYSRTVDARPDASGWDDDGKVNWYAYNTADGWRMIFLDDVKSLGIKYDYAKEKGLGGVGMWALGFDDGKGELWQLLGAKFGKKQYAARS